MQNKSFRANGMSHRKTISMGHGKKCPIEKRSQCDTTKNVAQKNDLNATQEVKMNNLMDTYITFTEKKIKKYMKTLLAKQYDENLVNEYLKTYINARYYNIQNADKPARAFYLRILEELEYKEDILMKKCEEEAQNLDEKQRNLNIIYNLKELFAYILFFDNVRNVENFKTIDNIKEIISKMVQTANTLFDAGISQSAEKKLYEEMKNDMLEKEIFLEKFDTDEFALQFENSKVKDEIYFVTLEQKVKMPMQYSEEAIEKVYHEGIVAEDKLQVEYILLSVVVISDIVNGNFNDKYIAEFTSTLFKKKQKLDSVLSILGNQALQDKISLNIMYSDYKKNQKSVLEYTKKGYNFTITLDNEAKSIEDVEELKMFKMVIVPQKLLLYKDIKSNKEMFNNVIFK